MSWAFLVAPWKNILVLIHSCLFHTGPASKSQIWYQMLLSVTKSNHCHYFLCFLRRHIWDISKCCIGVLHNIFFSLSNPLNVYFCSAMDPLHTVAPLKDDTLEFFQSSSNPSHPLAHEEMESFKVPFWELIIKRRDFVCHISQYLFLCLSLWAKNLLFLLNFCSCVSIFNKDFWNRWLKSLSQKKKQKPKNSKKYQIIHPQKGVMPKYVIWNDRYNLSWSSIASTWGFTSTRWFFPTRLETVQELVLCSNKAGFH